jgi:hypothetical protein
MLGFLIFFSLFWQYDFSRRDKVNALQVVAAIYNWIFTGWDNKCTRRGIRALIYNPNHLN